MKPGNRKSSRPVGGQSHPCFPLEMVVAVYDHQLSLPPGAVDVPLLEHCVAIIANGRDIPVTGSREAKSALYAQVFSQDVRRTRRKGLVAVVVLLLLLAGICLATGIVRWVTSVEKEEEWLRVEVETQLPSGIEPTAESPDVFAEGVYLLPSWMPAGYVLETTDILTVFEGWQQKTFSYQRGEETLLLRMDWFAPDTPGFVSQLETDDQPVELLEDALYGIYLYENLGSICARWSSAPFRVTVESENLTREEVRQIALSAFRKD